jgi:hypothetical protein
VKAPAAKVGRSNRLGRASGSRAASVPAAALRFRPLADIDPGPFAPDVIRTVLRICASRYGFVGKYLRSSTRQMEMGH